jgi:hypothetical protein
MSITTTAPATTPVVETAKPETTDFSTNLAKLIEDQKNLSLKPCCVQD